MQSNCLPRLIDPYGPGTGYCVYEIKSYASDSLYVSATANPPKAQLNSQANIQDATGPLNPHGFAGLRQITLARPALSPTTLSLLTCAV